MKRSGCQRACNARRSKRDAADGAAPAKGLASAGSASSASRSGHGTSAARMTGGGAAQKAGLSAGDVVIAADGLKVGRASLARMAGERAPGERLHLHVFRRDELFEVDVVLQAPLLEAVWFTIDDKAPAEAVARRNAWLTPRGAPTKAQKQS